jgi:parallel beta-helix repeat protein
VASAVKSDNLKQRKENLRQSILFSKSKKEEVVSIKKIFDDKLKREQISKEEYEKSLKQALGNRSFDEWIKYYNDYINYYQYQIKLCDKLAREERYREINKIIFPALIVLIIFVLLAVAVSLFLIFRDSNISPIKFGNGVFESKKLIEGSSEVKGILSEQKFDISVRSINAEIITQEQVNFSSVSVGKPVRASKIFSLDKDGGFNLELPKDAKVVGIKKIENGKEEDITPLAFIGEKGWINKRTEVKVGAGGITGNAVQENIEGGVEYEIIFELPGPQIKEEDIENGKKVIIQGPSYVEYTDILASSGLPEEVSSDEKYKVKVYKVDENGKKQEKEFFAYDLDENGKLDSVEWIADKTGDRYEIIIEISHALHLDGNKNFVSDIYNSVNALDGVWSPEIKEGEYVRVTFEQKLDKTRDITIYPRIISGNPKIEVYEIDGDEKIAEFEDIKQNQYNKIYLTGLIGEPETFDLKVVGGSVELDHVIDPLTPEQTANCFSGLVSYWTFDNADTSGATAKDVFGSNDGVITESLTGQPGKVEQSYNFDGVNDVVTVPDSSSLDLSGTDQFTISAWVNPAQMGIYNPIVFKAGADGGYSFFIRSDNLISITIKNGGGASLPARLCPSLAVGTWTHLVAMQNQTTVSLFCNGNHLKSWIFYDFANSPTPLYVGYKLMDYLQVGGLTELNNYFQGSIDEVTIYNRGLTALEINSIYQRGVNSKSACGDRVVNRWICNSGTRKFSDASCWSLARVPVPGDDILFNKSGIANCNITNNTMPQGLSSFTVDNNYPGKIIFAPLFAKGDWTGRNDGTQLWNVSGNITINNGTMLVYGDYRHLEFTGAQGNITPDGHGQEWKSVYGNITIAKNATLDGKGLGFILGMGPGIGGYHAGGSYGGVGGEFGSKLLYGNSSAPTSLGSGAGSGSAGSAIKLTAIEGTVGIFGQLNMNGAEGSGGSPSGGSIWIKAKNIIGDGLLEAKGGSENWGNGGGGGGRIRLEYISGMSFKGIIRLNGGSSSNYPGFSGSFTFTNSTWPGDWNLSGNIGLLGGDFGDGPTVNIMGNFSTNGYNITIYGDCFYTTSNPSTCWNKTFDGRGVWINASGNVNISTGSIISGIGFGFSAATGPGSSAIYGASHGGVGNNGPGIYGNLISPISLGSGGEGASGGAAIRIQSNETVYIDGRIYMDGESEGPSTGSGGSIWIQGKNIFGNGTLSSNSGLSFWDEYQGGGGRIALYAENILFSGQIFNKGDTGALYPGGGGTIYMNATSSIITSMNITTTGFAGGNITMNSTLLKLSGIYNASGINANGTIKIQFSDCGSDLFSAVFDPGFVNLGPICAGVINWRCNSGTMNFNDASCWSLSRVPVPGDNIVFNRSGIANCNITNNTMPQGLSSFTVDNNYPGKIIFAPLFAKGDWTGRNDGTQLWNVSGNITINNGTMLVYGDYRHLEFTGVQGNKTPEGHGQEWRSVYGNITIGKNAILDGNGLGFPIGVGPGVPVVGGGAGHGGRGTGYIGDLAGLTYGNPFAPTSLGSGGFNEGGTYSGGSAIKLAGSYVTVDGLISMETYYDNWAKNGASGGSIWLQGLTVFGNGTLQAQGGLISSNVNRGAGGGGRIFLNASDNINFTGIIVSSGGLETGTVDINSPGSGGTIFLETSNGNISINTSSVTTVGLYGGIINISGTKLVLIGNYNTSYSIGGISSGNIYLYYTDCSSSFSNAVFIPSPKYETGCPLIVTVKSPYNNSNFNRSLAEFNSSLNRIGSYCGLSIDSTANKTMTQYNLTWFNYTNSTIPNGGHRFILSCNDTGNNWGYSSSQNFLTDTIYPGINFTNPTNKNNLIQKNSDIFVNVTGNDTVSNISMFIDFDSSLLAWWRMDDLNSSGDIIDYTGKNNGTVFGDAKQTFAGKMGKGFVFDGDNDYVQFAGSESLSLSDSFTFSFWVNTKDVLINKYIYESGQQANAWVIAVVLGRIDFVELGIADNYAASTIEADKWYHVVITKNHDGSDNLRIYINGSLDSIHSVGAVSEPTGTPLIGIRNDLNRDFMGILDDIILFNRTLNESEVRALYANQSVSYLGVNFTGLADGRHVFMAYSQDMAGNVNKTEQREVTTGNLVFGCMNLDKANSEYKFGDNLVTGRNDNCINITAPNITLDCRGLKIDIDQNYAGIYSNATNTTIKNCNITMGSSGYSILLNSSNLSYVYNNTLYGRNRGVYSYSSFNLTLINNTFLYYGGDRAIFLANSTFNKINGNIIRGSWTYAGIDIFGGFNNSLISNTVSWTGGHGIVLRNSRNNALIDNTVSFNFQNGIFLNIDSGSTLIQNNISANREIGISLSISSNETVLYNNISSNVIGVYLSLSSRNNFTGNDIWNCTSIDSACLNFVNSENNTFIGSLIKNSSTSLIQFVNSKGNVVKDVKLQDSVSYSVYLAGSMNVSLVNVSYTTESVDSSSQLLRKWYYRAYVNDTTGLDVAGANVTAFNRTGNYNFNLTTNASGWTNITEIIDYVTYGAATYYSNYTIHADNITHGVKHFYNATFNKNNYNDFFTLNIIIPPEVIFVGFAEFVAPLEASYRDVKINFTVYDFNGFGDIDSFSAKANFTRSQTGELRDFSSCQLLEQWGIYYANYTCTIPMWYYDSPGDWNISVEIADYELNYAINNSNYFKYNTLDAWIMTPDPAELIFANVAVNPNLNRISDINLTLYNTGNTNIVQSNITAYDLAGESISSQYINSSWFSLAPYPDDPCLGTQLANATEVLSGFSLNYGFGVNNNLTFCLREVNTLQGPISSQAYSTKVTKTPWIFDVIFGYIISLIKLFGAGSVFLIVAVRRKNLEEDNLIIALISASKDLRLEHSNNKKKIVDLLINEIKRKNRLNNREIREIVGIDKDIPVNIFSGALGELEAIVKYLKENLYMNYKEISVLIGRDERTVWTAYDNAKKKDKKSFWIHEKDIFVPIREFKKNLTIFEALVLYLRKQKELGFNEIARMINRDQRNVWATYKRAEGKIREVV